MSKNTNKTHATSAKPLINSEALVDATLEQVQEALLQIHMYCDCNNMQNEDAGNAKLSDKFARAAELTGRAHAELLTIAKPKVTSITVEALNMLAGYPFYAVTKAWEVEFQAKRYFIIEAQEAGVDMGNGFDKPGWAALSDCELDDGGSRDESFASFDAALDFIASGEYAEILADEAEEDETYSVRPADFNIGHLTTPMTSNADFEAFERD